MLACSELIETHAYALRIILHLNIAVDVSSLINLDRGGESNAKYWHESRRLVLIGNAAPDKDQVAPKVIKGESRPLGKNLIAGNHEHHRICCFKQKYGANEPCARPSLLSSACRGSLLHQLS